LDICSQCKQKKGERMSEVSKCELYRFFYKDKVYEYEAIGLLGKAVNRDICRKAQIIFKELCSKCEINPF
jgi:hypothetical protein